MGTRPQQLQGCNWGLRCPGGKFLPVLVWFAEVGPVALSFQVQRGRSTSSTPFRGFYPRSPNSLPFPGEFVHSQTHSLMLCCLLTPLLPIHVNKLKLHPNS